MLLQYLLTIICLLDAARSRQVGPSVGEVQLIESQCQPPYITVGSQCVLVEGVTSEGCMSPFVAVGDQCLYFATFADLNHAEAQQMCHSLSSELVVIDTATKLYNIIHYITDNDLRGGFYWIDGSDEASEGTYLFTSGQPVPMGTPFWWANMEMQEPNNVNEHCVELSSYYYMNDRNCEALVRPLCEQPGQLNNSISLPMSQVDCPAFFVPVGPLCLSFMTWADQTWAEARQSCHGLSGELATITDIEQLRDIYIYLHQEGITDHSYWLGGSDAATEGMWIWTDGSSVQTGAPFWGYGGGYLEPDGASTENCLVLDAEGSHYFRDDSCSRLANPLCQY